MRAQEPPAALGFVDGGDTKFAQGVNEIKGSSWRVANDYWHVILQRDVDGLASRPTSYNSIRV
jgi:hypothetical protein